MMNFPLYELGKARQADLRRDADDKRDIIWSQTSANRGKGSRGEEKFGLYFAGVTFCTIVASLVW